MTESPLITALKKKAAPPAQDTQGLLETILEHLQRVEEYLKMNPPEEKGSPIVTTQESRVP